IRVIGDVVRALTATTARKTFVVMKTRPTTRITIVVPRGSSCAKAGRVATNASDAANAAITFENLLYRLPYQGISRRMSLTSIVPSRAIQQAEKGFAKTGSKTAARIGAVVMLATTPAGNRTEREAAPSVTPVQKISRTASMSLGSGRLTRTRIRAPAVITARTTRSSFRLSGNRTARGYGRAFVPRRKNQTKRGPTLPSLARLERSRRRGRQSASRR